MELTENEIKFLETNNNKDFWFISVGLKIKYRKDDELLRSKLTNFTDVYFFKNLTERFLLYMAAKNKIPKGLISIKLIRCAFYDDYGLKQMEIFNSDIDLKETEHVKRLHVKKIAAGGQLGLF